MIKHWILAVWVLISGFMPHAAMATNVNKPILLNESEWQTLREQPDRYADLLHGCERNIDRVAKPVELFVPQPRYSKDRDNNQGREAAKRLALDGWIAYHAALCYRLEGDRRFAQHAQQILDAWSGTLRHVEGRQGVANINFDLPAYVIAGYLVQGVGGWDDCQWRQFLQEVIVPLSVAESSNNNHGNWGVLLNVALGAYLHDDALLRSSQSRWQTLLQSQVTADGAMMHEICRSDTSNWCDGPTKGIKGIAYTHYALLPTTLAAQILDQQGYSVWQTSAGKLLGEAYARAAQWTQHPETFPYYEHNKGKLFGVRNGDYFAILQHQYPNEDGAQALAEGDLGLNGFRLSLLFSKGKPVLSRDK